MASEATLRIFLPPDRDCHTKIKKELLYTGNPPVQTRPGAFAGPSHLHFIPSLPTCEANVKTLSLPWWCWRAKCTADEVALRFDTPSKSPIRPIFSYYCNPLPHQEGNELVAAWTSQSGESHRRLGRAQRAHDLIISGDLKRVRPLFGVIKRRAIDDAVISFPFATWTGTEALRASRRSCSSANTIV